MEVTLCTGHNISFYSKIQNDTILTTEVKHFDKLIPTSTEKLNINTILAIPLLSLAKVGDSSIKRKERRNHSIFMVKLHLGRSLEISPSVSHP